MQPNPALPSPLAERLSSPLASPAAWRQRWPALARALGIGVREPVVLALSGGADSVLLLHWLRACGETPVTAVHVHHGLRGAEADADAEFCRELCRSLDVPFRLRHADLSDARGSIEDAARRARYAVLYEEARAARVRVLLTAHHADDALEGVLMRWVRGSDLPGLVGPEASGARVGPQGWKLRLARPLLGLRRDEIRRLLTAADLTWREDGSNADPRFTRNRVRNEFLPRVEAIAGSEGVEHLRHFAQAVERLEHELSERTAQLVWSPLPAVAATRRREDSTLGGALPRARLRSLPRALRRRALWRLLLEATTEAPSRALLDQLVSELDSSECARHGLRGGWILRLNRSSLELHPPLEALLGEPRDAEHQLRFNFADSARASRPSPWIAALAAPAGGFVLPVPGSVTLPDGRRIVASLVPGVVPGLDPGAATHSGPRPIPRPIPRTPSTVELDAAGLPTSLRVRWPAPGDRFHPFGAAGSRPLRRFLADAGVPSRERRLVPLVYADSELVWVAGLRPAHPRRVTAPTAVRLRLELQSGSPWRPQREDPERAERSNGRERQLELFRAAGALDARPRA
jgi:tRNA(Ile)-lysidine synthase